MEIIPNVHIISGTAVNCFLIVEPDGLTLIDTGLPAYAKKITAYLASIGHKPADITRILITHADGDHVGSLAHFKAASGATTYTSAIEAKAIALGETSRELTPGPVLKLLLNFTKRFFEYEAVKIDEILEPAENLPVLGELQVIPSPGHTPDHISFFSPSRRILFAGDSMRASKNKLITSRGINTWDEAQARESALLQSYLKPEIVCVGHGPIIREAANKFPQP